MNEDLLYSLGINSAAFENGIKSVISTLKSGALAFIGFGSAGGALKFVTDEALKNEKATMALASAVKSLKTGTEEGFLILNKYAASMSAATGIAQEDLKNALKELTYATGDTAAAQKSLGAVIDLAKAKNISLEQASKIVGKAYEGNTAMLKRYGIEIDAHAKGMTVINELTKKFGGAEDSYLATMQGKLDKAKNSFNLLANEIGQSFLPAMGDAANMVTKFLHSFTEEGKIEDEKKKISALKDSLSILQPALDYYTKTGDKWNAFVMQKKIDDVNKKLSEEEKQLKILNPMLDEYAKKTYALAKGKEEETASAEANDKDKLDSAKDFFKGMSSLSKTGNKELFEIGKAASLANIVVSTAEAIMNAYAKIPPPFNIPAAIGIGTAGAVELASASGAAFNPAGASEGVWDWRAQGNKETLVTTINHNEAIISKPQARSMGGTVNNYNFPTIIPSAAETDRIMREVIIPSQNRITIAKGQ